MSFRFSSLLALVMLTINSLYANNKILVNNKYVNRTFSISKNTPGAFSYLEYVVNGQNLLAKQQPPYFACSINNQLITANNPVWTLKNVATRALRNQATEKVITLKGHKKAKGIEVVLIIHYFDDSYIFREKLVIKKSGKEDIKLTTVNDSLYFKFPQIALKTQTNHIEEIKLGVFGAELIDSLHPTYTYDDRHNDNAQYFNLTHAHMFHPAWQTHTVQKQPLYKGPLFFADVPAGSWLLAYEHAGQDSRLGFKDGNERLGQTDAAQGVEGDNGLPQLNDDFFFLGLQVTPDNSQQSRYFCFKAKKGVYLPNQIITQKMPFETVFFASGFVPGNQKKHKSMALYTYLQKDICYQPEARKSDFYFNTWGLQRSEENQTGLRDILTLSRIKAEVDRAAELGIKHFVLDDGWQTTMGNWTPHPQRLNGTLAQVRKYIESKGMKMGIWLSPMGIDKSTKRFKENQNWVIRNQDGTPIKAQWGHPAFDFVGPFKDVFVADCKRLIDQGARFFKWDAINAFGSTLPNLHHGGQLYTKQQLRDRYAYLLPIYVANAMQELCEYEPDLLLEIDLTEPERVMIGLITLQYGKYFFMNNGATWYNDYSHYRAKSMRTTINAYKDILPPEVITYSNYPINKGPYFAMRYNVNSSLISGYGFWGNLELTNSQQRKQVYSTLSQFFTVQPYLYGTPTSIDGLVGATPEIYSRFNPKNGFGQVVAFSGSAAKHQFLIEPADSVLGATYHAFFYTDSSLMIPFEFKLPDDSREVFLYGNLGTGLKITKCTTWLKKLDFNGNNLVVEAGDNGMIDFKIPDGFVLKSNNHKLTKQASILINKDEKMVFSLIPN